LVDAFSKRRASHIRGAETLKKRKSIVSLNSVEEAFEKYSELMPAVNDVRAEKIRFDLGSYTHLLQYEGRVQYISWIKETLVNPEEIRQNFDRRFPFREIYINTVYESSDDPFGRPFIVVVDRRITLNFWTAFVPEESYLRKARKGKLLWRPEN
jgi:hypothetical protein